MCARVREYACVTHRGPEKKLYQTKGYQTLTAVSERVSIIRNIEKHTSESMKRRMNVKLDME